MKEENQHRNRQIRENADPECKGIEEMEYQCYKKCRPSCFFETHQWNDKQIENQTAIGDKSLKKVVAIN
jgi:hypothetical protein